MTNNKTNNKALVSSILVNDSKEMMTSQMMVGGIVILIGIITEETKWGFIRNKYK